MKTGQVKDAEVKALSRLHQWNKTTGFFDETSGYWYEIQSLVEDAVHIGIQMAINGKVQYDKDGEIIKPIQNSKT